MAKMSAGKVGLVCLVLLSGCASQDVQILQKEKEDLQSRLDSANIEIRRLKQEELSLRDKVSALEHTASVLATEKSSRVEESSSLRAQVRKFVQNNVDAFKQFMVQGNLLDYVGSELVARAKQDKQPAFLVDFANVMPTSGILTGVGGHFTQAGNFIVKVLHPVGGQHVVIWESKTVEVERPGKQQFQFPVSVGVEKGDVIAYYFITAPNVAYDISTGDTLYQTADVALGGAVSKTFLSGATERRAYSLGVYGLLDTNQ
jgi:hypothetical protein